MFVVRSLSVHVRAEAGETTKAEHTASKGSEWLFLKKTKKKRNHKLSSETTLKHNGIEASYKK